MELENGIRDIKLKNHHTCEVQGVEDRNDVKFEEELEELLKKIAKREGFVSYDVERKLISNVGGNYLGTLYEVNIRDKTFKCSKELNLFLKKIIMIDETGIFSIKEAYTKEMFMYNELAKIYEELQREANIPDEEIFSTVKCYGVLNKARSESLILDNMCKKGYKTCDRFEPICQKFAELSVIDLAKFHAIGFALENKRPHYMDAVIKKLSVPFNKSEKFNEFIRNFTPVTINSMKDESIKRKLENFIENNMMKNFISYYEHTKYSTLCHGDFRANNILVQEKDGELIRTMPVDYQLIYYGCPLNDFLYFIFSATDQQFRNEHLERLKNLYYDTLKKFLKYFHLNVELIYPRAAFDKDYKERLDYGLMMAIMVLPFILANEGDVPDLSKVELTDIKLSDKQDNNFKERIIGVVDDYLKWGYL